VFKATVIAADGKGAIDIQRIAQKIKAADNRDDVASRMTPTQIAEARRLPQQCQVQQFKGC
jgi:hypothetical protein